MSARKKKLSVEEARARKICRICRKPPQLPLILDFGREYACEKCLVRETVLRSGDTRLGSRQYACLAKLHRGGKSAPLRVPVGVVNSLMNRGLLGYALGVYFLSDWGLKVLRYHRKMAKQKKEKP